MKKLIVITLLLLTACSTEGRRIYNALRNDIFPRTTRDYKIESLFGNDIGTAFMVGQTYDEKYEFYVISTIHEGGLFQIRFPKEVVKLIFDSKKPYCKVILKTDIEDADVCFDESLVKTVYKLKSPGCWACFGGVPKVRFEVHVPKDTIIIDLNMEPGMIENSI